MEPFNFSFFNISGWGIDWITMLNKLIILGKIDNFTVSDSQILPSKIQLFTFSSLPSYPSV